MNDAVAPSFSRVRLRQATLVLCVCGLVFWLGLGARPFGSSEGHRVVPGWTMQETGDWWSIRMFGQTYLRKPPGMPWAIGGMARVLGESEFSARSVSALASTVAALAALWFGTRWFGSRGGLACGLMQATLPLFWSPGRSAEIEALNNLGTQLAALGVIDLVLSGRAAGRWMGGLGAEGQRAGLDPMRIGPAAGSDAEGTRPLGLVAVMVLVAGAGIIVAGLAKGPASLPVLGGVLIGSCIALRSALAVSRVWIGAAMALGGGVLWVIARRVLEANNAPDAVRQGADDFLWNGGARAIGKVLLMAPTAFVSAMPASLAFLFVWGKGARREAAGSGSNATRRAYAAARMLAWVWVVTVGITTVAGVSNARYAMPAAFVFPMLCGYVVRGAWGVQASFEKDRREWARALTFKNASSWPAVLCVAAVLGGQLALRQDKGEDPRKVAGELYKAIGNGPVLADDLIEARPDVLLYYERKAPAPSKLRPVALWKKADMLAGSLPRAGEYIILRTDKESSERRRYGEAIADGKLVLVKEGMIGKYGFEVYRRAGEEEGKPSP